MIALQFQLVATLELIATFLCQEEAVIIYFSVIILTFPHEEYLPFQLGRTLIHTVKTL